MRKLAIFLILLIFIGMLWTILALAIPAVGEGSRILFVEVLGKGIVTGIVGASHTIMIWGSESFPQASAVILGTGVTFLILGIGFSRLIWPRLPLVHKKAVVVQTPLQSQLSTPDLYVQKAPVEQKVEVKAEEKQ